MEFGAFHEFPRRKGQTEADSFAEGFELVDAAERWGLDAMWLAELHFSPTARSSPPPHHRHGHRRPHGADEDRHGRAWSCRLSHPLRLAEEWATVDQISGG